MTNHFDLFRIRAGRTLIFVGTLALASTARESIGDELTESNVLPQLCTTPSYSTVTLAPNGTNAVKFTVTANKNCPEYSSLTATFGVTSFTFRSSLTLVATDITFLSPSVGCGKTPNPKTSPFGQFDWMVTAPPGTTTLIFNVNHTGATTSTFENPNANHATFSSLIGGIVVSNPSIKSHWVSEGVATFSPVVLPVQTTSSVMWVTGGLVILAVPVLAYLVLKKRSATPSS